MKDFRPALVSILVASSDVTSYVGSGTSARIFPVQLPQGEKMPSIVYSRITELSDYHMEGDSGLATARVQVDAWGIRPDIASGLSNAAHDVLSGFRGVQEEVEIQGVFHVNSREDFDASAELFRMSRDYMLWYRTRSTTVFVDNSDPLMTESSEFLVDIDND